MTRYDYLGEADFDLEAFSALLDEPTDPSRVPAADEIIDHLPVYDGAVVDALVGGWSHDPVDAPVDPMTIRDLMAEWAWALGSGPGALVVRGAIGDMDLLDRVSAVFASIIESERDRDGAHGDHFATAGANDRIWNSHEKLCLADPDLFMAYGSTPTIAFAGRAWLGPHYQITTQVNVVNPGADAQRPHRDYHLGFYTPDETLEFPVHVHEMSTMLTLQGAIAHDDIPLEMGPTKILPNSQRFTAGFAISERARFSEIFEERYVQVPLGKGDALFFNPAVLHAAGENRTTDRPRMANLMQLCSAFTRALEHRDTDAMCRAVYPRLRSAIEAGEVGHGAIARVVAATAEGYAFPTSLDTDPSLKGLAPDSQAQIMAFALAEGWDIERFGAALDERNRRRPQGC
jgi:ectoine hydroxylase-related dioxygenase (phytanoyl-CoA dioxygenase family)